MRRNRLFQRIATLGCFAWLAVTLNAQETNKEANSQEGPAAEAGNAHNQLEPRTFQVAIRQGESAGWEQIRRVLVTVGTNEFSLLVPHGYRVASGSEKVTLISPDENYFLTFRILSQYMGPELARWHVTDQIPTATIVEDYSKSAAGREGPAYKMRGTVSGMNRSLRMALIPSAVGTLEFTLNADVHKATEGENAFTALLRTFRSNERGKLEKVVHLSDKT